MKLPAAAKAAGISKARWSQIESGFESRFGGYREVRGRAGTIAHMAAAVGLDPDRLETEGRRPDAAAVLREILRGASAGPLISLNPDDYLAEPWLRLIVTDPVLSDSQKRELIFVALRQREQGKPGNGERLRRA